MQNLHNGFYTDVTGVILAGGLNNRMDQDKATLTFSGTTFAKVERVMRSLFKNIYIAGNRSDLAGDKLTFYKDQYPHSSLTGLHTALRHAATEWVCVMPCDQPYPSPALIKCLVDARHDSDAVIPQHYDSLEPLVACYRKDCLPLIEQHLDNAQYSFNEFLAELNVRTMGPSDLPNGWRRALFNVNDPDNLAKLKQPTPAVTVIACSGTGKTTLLEKLINELTIRGWTVGAFKHDAHRFEIDHEGKDSWRMTRAGAAVTTISSRKQTATVRRHDLEPTIKEILERDFCDVDIVLTEGFKQSNLPKIEVHRHALGNPLLCRGENDDPTLIAVASDSTLNLDVPVFDLNEPEAIARFVERTFLE